MAGLLVAGLMVARWLGAGVLVAGVLRLGGWWLVAGDWWLVAGDWWLVAVVHNTHTQINFICDHRNFKGNPFMSMITNEIIGNFP